MVPKNPHDAFRRMKSDSEKQGRHPRSGKTAPPLTTAWCGACLGVALFALTFVAYWPVLWHGGFIWDDNDYVLENKTLREFNGLRDIWLSPRATPQYYPLVHTGYWIEYQLWGLHPTGYHVTNVILHGTAALLLWVLLRRLAVPGAWLAAALFAVHPVHVESVAWITERKNVLSGVFYLAAALVYLKWTEALAAGRRSPWAYAGAFALYVCALLSKTVTASLPAALLLVFWWQDGQDAARNRPDESLARRWLVGRILPLVPFFLVGLALSYITVRLEKEHVGATGAEWDLNFIDRCLIAGRALWFYVGKLLWPAHLCFSYPRWTIDSSVWWQYLYPLAFAALVALLWAGRKRLGRGPLVAMLFFAGTLLPALGFFDVYPMRYSFVADHFQYLASIGVIVLVAAGIARSAEWVTAAAPDMTAAAQRLVRPARYAAVAVLLSALVVASRRQCRIYDNLEALWLDTVAKNPASWMAYNNLGQFYLHDNRPERAIEPLEQAIRHNPRDVSAINNLGVALVALGRIDEAKDRYAQALATDPLDPQAYSNLGVALAKQGHREEAIESYGKALELDPSLAATHHNLGLLLAEMGRLDESLRHFDEAVTIAPELGSAHMSYADVLMAAGRVRDAADHYRSAIALDPTLAGAHYQLGKIALADQLLPAALEHFRDAVRYAPDHALAHNGLAVVLAAIGRHDDAADRFKTALALAPESGPIHLDYARFLLSHGDKRTARIEFLEAAKWMPDDPTPRFQAGVLDQQLGDLAAAEARFRYILGGAEYGPACNHLAFLLAARGENKEAIELLRRAVKTEPANAEYHNNLGVILVRAGDREEALAALEEAVRLNPDYAEARTNLADLQRLMKSQEQP
jgi:Flp pilus assembly protein TadD